MIPNAEVTTDTKYAAEFARKMYLVWYIPRLQKLCSVLQGM